MYGWPGRDAKSPYDRYRKSEYPWNNGFINGDGVIYFPGAKPGIPDYRQPVDTVPYALIDIFESEGLWDRRELIDWNMDGCGGGPKGTLIVHGGILVRFVASDGAWTKPTRRGAGITLMIIYRRACRHLIPFA